MNVREFFREVVRACQPRELVEAHREIERVHKLYAAAILREAHARATVERIRARCREGRDGPYSLYTNVVKDDILDILESFDIRGGA